MRTVEDIARKHMYKMYGEMGATTDQGIRCFKDYLAGLIWMHDNILTFLCSEEMDKYDAIGITAADCIREKFRIEE